MILTVLCFQLTNRSNVSSPPSPSSPHAALELALSVCIAGEADLGSQQRSVQTQTSGPLLTLLLKHYKKTESHIHFIHFLDVTW